MCGRASLATSEEELREFLSSYGVEPPEWYLPRYNIAPSQDQMVIVERDGERAVHAMRWGLIPFWAKDKKIGNSLVMARSESVASKPAFREALKRRRGLMIVDSYYEWRKEPNGPKTPFRIHREDGKPFALAALWEQWGPKEERIESCSVLTRDANEVLSPIHERMPVIVDGVAADAWLDVSRSADEVQSVIAGEVEGMAAYPVSQFVNSPANNSAVCWEREEA